MRQALHILKKDVAHLRYQIALVLAATGAFGWSEIRGLTQPTNSEGAETLVLVATVFLMVMLVHAEAIPGDRQYWLTRPFAWKSLLGAKLLFLVAFVNLPMFLTQFAIVVAGRFSLIRALPGLLWSQLLLTLCLWLPIAALAAVTARIATFLFFVLILMGAEVGSGALLQRFGQAWVEGVDWVRSAFAAIAVMSITAVVLYVQYQRRSTWFSRAFMLVAAVVISAAYLAMPWPLAFAVQSRLAKPPRLPLDFSLASAPTEIRTFNPQPDQVQVRFPIEVRGVPDGVDLQANALTMTVEGPDGRRWDRKLQSISDLVQHPNGRPALLNENVFLDRAFFTQERDRPVTIRAILYLTLFGAARSRSVPLSREPANVLDGLQCYTFTANLGWDVYCRSLFRWPSAAIYAQVGGIQTNAFTRLISFSPFPAGLNLSPLEVRWAPVYPYGATPPAHDVTITVKKPLAHIRRDFEVRNVRLAKFALPGGQRTVVRNGVSTPAPDY